LLPLLLGACQHYQSTWSGASADVRQFNFLFLIFLAVCGAMYLFVIGFLAAAILRRRRSNGADRGLRGALIGWSALVAVGLGGLAVASFVADRSLAGTAAGERLSITVIAHQWWWEVRYNSTDPGKVMRTANELHLPVGLPVRITLQSSDVIHSFWVPSLAGKEDLIPGRETDVTILPTRIGLYRGQCAEFCGTQHAHMALVVRVDSQADFVKWWQHQLQPAPRPHTPLAEAGHKIATQPLCASCHTIGGTTANGRAGPDLTHLASRRSIAAGTLPMGKGNLYGWVANPQAIKPGAKMPAMGLEPDQLHAVVAYLETLK
jgi:cytochrome c oxidase subunit 2